MLVLPYVGVGVGAAGRGGLKRHLYDICQPIPATGSSWAAVEECDTAFLFNRSTPSCTLVRSIEKHGRDAENDPGDGVPLIYSTSTRSTKSIIRADSLQFYSTHLSSSVNNNISVWQPIIP